MAKQSKAALNTARTQLEQLVGDLSVVRATIADGGPPFSPPARAHLCAVADCVLAFWELILERDAATAPRKPSARKRKSRTKDE